MEGKSYRHTFDHVFDQDATQQDVFSQVSQLVQRVIDGQSVCVFAHGQARAGKTYSLGGEHTDKKKGGY